MKGLWSSRWLLATAVAAAILAHGVGGLSWAPAVILTVAVAAVAWVIGRDSWPSSSGIDAAAGNPQPADALSAAGLAAAVADPLIVFDSRGFVTLANSAAVTAFDDVADGISLPLKFRTPEMQDLIEQMLSGRSTTGTVDYAERVPLDRSYRVTATAVGLSSGLFVVVFKDQSEARRIDRMRADFIANASHELRTPLASISGFVETLRGPARNDPMARDQFLQIMQNQTARMARLIDDLLSLSRLEMKAITLDGSDVELSEIVTGVVDSLTPLAEESSVVIDNQFGSDPLVISGDRDELFQVFQNLMENACKYGRDGGRIVIARRRGGTDAHPEVGVEVRDFGPGIAEEHIPRVTERFYRVDVESSRAQKGTGLGLAIVKHIMTRHRGRLAIASKPSEGAAFTAWFPLG